MKLGLLLLALLGAISALGEVIETNLAYPKIDLTNGTTLTTVVIKSFDSLHGTVMLMAGKNLKTVRVSLLPAEIATRINALAPKMTDAERQAALNDEKAKELDARRRAEEREIALAAEAKAVRTESRKLNVRTADNSARKDDGLLASVATIAEQKARHFFKYEYNKTAGAEAYAISTELDMEEPEPVDGWVGRYRVCGTAYGQFLGNTGGSVSRTSRRFEVLVDTVLPKGTGPKVVDITVK